MLPQFRRERDKAKTFSVSTFTTGPFLIESNGQYMTGIIMLKFH